MPVIAHAAVTVSWNAGAPAPAATAAPQSGIVTLVNGTHVRLRLPDGTVHEYVATPDEARALRALVGRTILFRLR
jgi:hypothetical protein